VLWYCGLYVTPCSECLDPAKICAVCELKACTDCLLTDDLCKDCEFICVECEGVFMVDQDRPIKCEGSRGIKLVNSLLGHNVSAVHGLKMEGVPAF
jgi:hypothetical protein